MIRVEPGENKGGVLKECVWTPVQVTLDTNEDETPGSFMPFFGLEIHFLLLGMDTSLTGGGFKGSTGVKDGWRSVGRASNPTLGITTSKDLISKGCETVALALCFHLEQVEDWSWISFSQAQTPVTPVWSNSTFGKVATNPENDTLIGTGS